MRTKIFYQELQDNLARVDRIVNRTPIRTGTEAHHAEAIRLLDSVRFNLCEHNGARMIPCEHNEALMRKAHKRMNEAALVLQTCGIFVGDSAIRITEVERDEINLKLRDVIYFGHRLVHASKNRWGAERKHFFYRIYDTKNSNFNATTISSEWVEKYDYVSQMVKEHSIEVEEWGEVPYWR